MIVLLQTSWSELQTGVIAKPVLDHLASNWNVWWNRSWLVASVSFALQEKKEESSAGGRANKIKESSCGVSLANNEDRQKIEIQRGFTTKTWGKNMHFDMDLHSGSRAHEDICWRPFPARLAFLCHTCETPASYRLIHLPLLETAKHDITILKPPSQSNFSFVWLVPSIFPKP